MTQYEASQQLSVFFNAGRLAFHMLIGAEANPYKDGKARDEWVHGHKVAKRKFYDKRDDTSRLERY
jgi:hypothetical protein